MSHAWASATRWPPPRPRRAPGHLLADAFMNSALVATFIVPKSAHGWPLMVLSACGPCAVLSPARAPITVAKSPVALAKEWSSA